MDRTTIILLVSALVGALTRAFNEDLPIFKNLTKPVRAIIAAGLGIGSAVVDNLSTPGSTLQSAIVTAVSVSGPSFLLLVIEAIGGGGTAGGATSSYVGPKADRPEAPPYSTKMVAYPALVVAAFAIALTTMLCGCAGSLEASKRTTPKTSMAVGVTLSGYCIGLDNGSRTWGAIAKGAVALSGAGGISTLPIPDTDKGARLAVLSASAGIAALGVVALFVQDSDTSAWARDCATSAPGAR